MICQLCGERAPVLRRIDEPLALKWANISRKLPRGAMVCAKHYPAYKGRPGAYVSKEDVA